MIILEKCSNGWILEYRENTPQSNQEIKLLYKESELKDLLNKLAKMFFGCHITTEIIYHKDHK